MEAADCTEMLVFTQLNGVTSQKTLILDQSELRQ